MYQRKNFAYGKVATAPSPAASGTTLVLETGQGARFPNTSGGTYVCVVKQTNLPATPDNAEVVLVTSHDPANDNFTIDRAEEGSGARTIEVGDEFYLSPTDGVWDQIDKLTTKGDLLGFSTEYVRVAVGKDTYILTADSTEASGIKWKPLGTESQIKGEIPSGDIDGVNDEFTLANTPFTDTLALYMNGVRQKITDDYTLSTATITFVTPPLAGSKLLADYNLNVSPSGNADTLDGQHLSGIVPTLKATGAEINTGTEDTKIVTPKAIADSDIASGWTPSRQTWTRESDNSFSEPINATLKYQKGDKLRYKQGGGWKYQYIISVGAYSGGKTIMTTTGGSDYVFTNGTTITDNYYSHQENPIGFPANFSCGAFTFDVNTVDNGSGGQPTAGINKFFIINGRLTIRGAFSSSSNYKVNSSNNITITALPATLPVNSSMFNIPCGICFGNSSPGVVIDRDTGQFWFQYSASIPDNTDLTYQGWEFSYFI